MIYHWNRQTYSGRGKLQLRDFELEKIISGACLICCKTLERKQYPGGRLETLRRFEKRKTCGKVLIKGFWEWTPCLLKYAEGETNGNYKGLLPHCVDCGKKVGYYTKSRKESRKIERCQKCFFKWWLTHPSPKQLEHRKKISWKKGQPPCGVPFKKGHKTWNKKYDFCTTEDCNNKHLARGLCKKHYSRQFERKTKKCPTCENQINFYSPRCRSCTMRIRNKELRDKAHQPLKF